MKTNLKTIQKVISKSKFVLLALVVIFNFACSVEDGNDGAIGPAGPAGANGTDGNANVRTFIYDISSMNGSNDFVSIPEITQDVLDNDVILGYLTDDGDFWVTIPCPFDTYQFDFSVRVTISFGYYELDFGDGSGGNYSIAAGDLQELKVIIIESTSTTTGKTINNKQQIYNELAQAGVDINDYQAVCDYYGIAH